jgi:uncharacterized protein (DUF433 family)
MQFMQVEDFLDIISPDEIRLRGHRIWIEHVLEEHLGREMTPVELTRRFPTLSMQQVLAVLLYYHSNRELMDGYLARQREAMSKVSPEQRNDDRYARLQRAKRDMATSSRRG